MATPVMTAGDPSQYAQYKDSLNQILYSKQQWQKGLTDQNKGLQNWAAGNAKPLYSELPTELASSVQGMSVDALTQFYNSLTSGAGAGAGATPTVDPNSPLGQFQSAVNPYDQQVADTLDKLKNYQPPVNPFDQAMRDLLSQLAGAINTPIADPTSTPQFAAAQARNERGKATSINDAAEVLGGSGLARSSIVTDRAQEIGQQFQDYMETQIIPGIVQQLQDEKNQKISGIGSLLTATGDQQKTVDTRNSEEYKRLGTLYDAFAGQQGAFDQRIQNEFTNAITQGTADLEKTKADHQFKIDDANLKLNEINSALTRTQTMGKVSAADAKILGVPAGTPSFQAANAVAQRKHELETQKIDNEAAMARTNATIAGSMAETKARIAADKDAAKLASEKNASYEKERTLISIWDQTGKAPKGLEAYGINEGMLKADAPQSPQDLLAQMQLDEAKSLKEEQDLMKKNVPLLQKQFKTDKPTAEAIWTVYDNPSREAALADYNSSKADMRTHKIDVKKVAEAIDDKWPPAPKEKPIDTSTGFFDSPSGLDALKKLPGVGIGFGT